jgi:hypothetical protein
MVIIFIGSFRVIIDLHLITIIYRHPFLEGLYGYPDKHPGVAVEFLHFENNPNGTILKLSFRRIQESHPTRAPDQAVLHGMCSFADLLPSAQILSIK